MKLHLWIAPVGLAVCAGYLGGQTTTIDLSRQGRLGTGAQLPAQCTVGQMFLKTGAPQGANLHVCASSNTWSVAGAYTAGAGIAITGTTLAVDDAFVPVYYAGAGAPTIDCAPGRDVYIDTNAGRLYFCAAAGQWQEVSLAGHTHSADAVTAGILAAERLPAAVVLNGQTNTFAAGRRQSMGHDSSNAGLRLAPAAGDPASVQDGDLWYNSTTNKFRRRQNGIAMDWDVFGAAFTTQPNTFTAGARQSMGHDATNAGLRLIPASGDPAGAQDGDVWYNATSGKFRRRQGGTISDWDVSGGVLSMQANTFTAGARQSMGHDATNAGLRLIPASGDPAGAQDGDVWYNATSGKFRRRQGGSIGDWDGVLSTQPNTFTAGARQSVEHDATNAGLRLIPASGDPAGAQDGDVWYNATSGKFRRRQGGTISDWDVSGGFLSTQANTFTAGARQSMGHDATNAGLRLIPASGDPAGAQDGDVWYNATSGKFRRRQGGTSSDWDVSGGVAPGAVNLGSASLLQEYANDSVTGTTQYLLAIGTGASKQVKNAGAATSGILGVCVSGCGASSTAQIGIRGRATCTFSNATTAWDYVQADGATSKCKDAGASVPTSGGQVIGQVLETGAAGNHEIRLGAEPQAVSGGGGGGATMAGHYKPFGESNSYSGGFTPTAGTAYYFRFTLDSSMPLSSVIWYPGATSSGTHIAVAIMDGSCNKVGGSDINLTSLAAGGGYNVMHPSSPPLTLTAGQEYYLAIAGEAAYLWWSWGGTTGGTSWFLFSGAADIPYFTGSAAPTGSGGTYAIPASCGAKTRINDAARPLVVLTTH